MDSDWAACLMSRGDFRWRKSLDFVAVAFNVLLRRKQIRAARVLMKRKDFIHTAREMLKVDAKQMADAATVLGEGGSVRDALRSPYVSDALKVAIKQMELVQGRIPCTDAYRTSMRYEINSLRIWMGFPAIFATLNPADTRHPLVAYYADEMCVLGRKIYGITGNKSFLELDNPFSQCATAPHLHLEMLDIIAKDPMASVQFFTKMVQLIIQHVFGIDKKLPIDMIASDDIGGVLGHVEALYGCVEPQTRGSLHLHMLVWIYGLREWLQRLQAAMARVHNCALNLRPHPSYTHISISNPTPPTNTVSMTLRAPSRRYGGL
jgi:hypothetical protein